MHDSETSLLQTRQDGLSVRVIYSLVFGYGLAKVKCNACESNPLAKKKDGLQVFGTFSYSIVVDMLLYLAGNTCLKIAYVVNIFARYMFAPRHYSEL